MMNLIHIDRRYIYIDILSQEGKNLETFKYSNSYTMSSYICKLRKILTLYTHRTHIG